MYAGFYDLIWVWCSCKCSYTVYKHNCFGKMGGRERREEKRRRWDMRVKVKQRKEETVAKGRG